MRPCHRSLGRKWRGIGSNCPVPLSVWERVQPVMEKVGPGQIHRHNGTALLVMEQVGKRSAGFPQHIVKCVTELATSPFLIVKCVRELAISILSWARVVRKTNGKKKRKTTMVVILPQL